MNKINTDVDIDVFGRDEILAGLTCAFCRIDRDEKFEKHPTGIYLQDIPKDPFTNIASLDYKKASEFGYFKIDFLNVNFYEGIKSEEHLAELINREPDWNLFEYEEITDQLFHLNGKSKLLQKFKPKSIEDLAMILAIIRPSKAYLQNTTWDRIKKEVWVKNNEVEGYEYKRTHSISYSIAIIVNLNLIIEKLEKENFSPLA